MQKNTYTEVDVADSFFKSILSTMVYRTVSFQIEIPIQDLEETNETIWSAVEDVDELAPTNLWSVSAHEQIGGKQNATVPKIENIVMNKYLLRRLPITLP